jgi:hypothetical protein
MSRFLPPTLLALLAAPALAADPPPFSFTAVKDGDSAEIALEKDCPVFRITSAAGVGRAEATAKDGKWPKRATFQFLKFRSLEGFSVGADAVVFKGALSRDAKPSVYLFDKDGKETKDKDKAACTLVVEAKKDLIEVVVTTAAPLKDAKTWKVSWVDAYREE